jgi:hypothetical protein
VHARPVIACLWPDLQFTPERVNQIADHITDFSLCALRAQCERTSHDRSQLREA